MTSTPSAPFNRSAVIGRNPAPRATLFRLRSRGRHNRSAGFAAVASIKVLRDRMTSIRDLLVAECGRPSVAAGSRLAVGRHDQQLLSTVEPLRVEYRRRVVVTTSPERVVYALNGVVMNGPYPLQMLCCLGLAAHCQQCYRAQMVRLAVVRPGVAGGAGAAGRDRRRGRGATRPNAQFGVVTPDQPRPRGELVEHREQGRCFRYRALPKGLLEPCRLRFNAHSGPNLAPRSGTPVPEYPLRGRPRGEERHSGWKRRQAA